MKKYKLEIALNDEGVISLESENDGFPPFELLGLLHWKTKDIENQILGSIKPDVITRKAISD